MAIAGAVALLLLLIPISYQASPEWSVTVVDQIGHPLQGMLVRLDYENYSVENTSHEQDLYTDANGRVIFPAHREAASTLSRCYYTSHSAMALAHASFGPIAYINVFGNGRQGSATSDGVIYIWNVYPRSVCSTIMAKPLKQ
jgi:hypothetical protein